MVIKNDFVLKYVISSLLGNANRFKTEVECNEQCGNKNTRNG